MKNIAIFVSGSGSNMQSIIDATLSGDINGQVVYVVTNKDGIGAIDRAVNHNIEYGVYKVSAFDDKNARDRAILGDLQAKEIDLIVLAGYLGIVTSIIIDEYKGKIINIHPSLIPMFCGDGMYGVKVHQAVILAGEVKSGCTVHYVDNGVDTGTIIKQAVVCVLEGDTAETLQKRVLEQEHKVLPEVVAMLCK